jgi:hypothetical protein
LLDDQACGGRDNTGNKIHVAFTWLFNTQDRLSHFDPAIAPYHLDKFFLTVEVNKRSAIVAQYFSDKTVESLQFR